MEKSQNTHIKTVKPEKRLGLINLKPQSSRPATPKPNTKQK